MRVRHAVRYYVDMDVCPYCAADGESSPLYDLREETVTIMSLVHVREAKGCECTMSGVPHAFLPVRRGRH